MLATILSTLSVLTGGTPSLQTISEDCDSSSRLRPQSIMLLPDNIIAGQHININLVYLNDWQIINGGIQKMRVKFNGIPYYVPSEDLCAYNNGLCPIDLGLHAINHTFNAPTVPGIVDMTLSWLSPSGESLLCLREKFTIEKAKQPRIKRRKAPAAIAAPTPFAALPAPTTILALDAPTPMLRNRSA